MVIVKKPLKKDEILENKINRIIEDTFKEIMSLDENSRPKNIYLYNSNQEYLVKVLIGLGIKFKKYEEKNNCNLNISLFTGNSSNGEYNVDVGYYLRR